MKKTAYILSGILAASMGLTSCGDDFLDTEYTRYLTPEEAGQAAADDPDAFLNGMWSYAVAYRDAHDRFGFMATLLSKEFMGEDIAFSGSHFFIYDYQLDYRMADWARPSHDWVLFYTMISKANEVLDGFPNGATTPGERSLAGQAYAVRGWAYYYLIQIFQNPTSADGGIDEDMPGVPMIFTSGSGKSADEIAQLKSRNTVKDVMAQIESDLTEAVKLLDGATERKDKNGIDYNVASGLLARYYLLAKEWSKAAEAAKNAREGYAVMSETDLTDGFMSVSNKEWMWGFAHNAETQTAYASYFSHISNFSPGYAGLGLASKLIDARLYSQIPETDVRKGLFNGPDGDAKAATAGAKKPYASLKFGDTGDWTMDYLYMRASEMVLIEAEAYARLGNGAKAAEVLSELMKKRQSDWNETSVDVEDVLFQRRIELWGEGFVFFDLKRCNKGINRKYEGTNHFAGCQLDVPARDVMWTYQIPTRELQENKLISEEDQND